MADDVRGALINSAPSTKPTGGTPNKADLEKIRQGILAKMKLAQESGDAELHDRLMEEYTAFVYGVQHPELGRLSKSGFAQAASDAGTIAALTGVQPTAMIGGMRTKLGGAMQKAGAKIAGGAPEAGAAATSEKATSTGKKLAKWGAIAGAGYVASGALTPAREAVEDVAGSLAGTTAKKEAKAAAAANLDYETRSHLAQQEIDSQSGAEKITAANRRYELDSAMTTALVGQANKPMDAYSQIMNTTAQGAMYLPSVSPDIYAAVGISPINLQQLSQQVAANQQATNPQ